MVVAAACDKKIDHDSVVVTYEWEMVVVVDEKMLSQKLWNLKKFGDFRKTRKILNCEWKTITSNELLYELIFRSPTESDIVKF